MDFIRVKLEAGKYRLKPARSVLLPKEGISKKRKLGIPVVMDRIVSQSLNLVLEEIYDPGFTASNFGFRRGKSQHRAIRHVQGIVQEGHEWCASIDLKSFFDEIRHGLILKLIRRKIADEALVTLVARALKAGVVVDWKMEKTTKGCPPGFPGIPDAVDIVLNELDQELEKRGLQYCRWADDFLMLLKSEGAADRVMDGIVKYLEEELNLQVNREKSMVSEVKGIPFLGFQILRGKIGVSYKARAKLKVKVRKLTWRNNPLFHAPKHPGTQQVPPRLGCLLRDSRVQETIRGS